MSLKLDILAFGAHPDDIELSCAGLLLVEKSMGKKIGVADLTEGEMGSRGDTQTRYQESADASAILELDARINLQLPDCFFENNKESKLKVIQAIRKYKPDVILCNSVSDRHPDHARASQLVSDAAFLSGLIKIETKDEQGAQVPWRPAHVFHYIQDRFLSPDFIIDITEFMDKKIASIKAYKSQFHNPGFEGPETYISKPAFLEQLISTHQILGKKIGVAYGEGYITHKKIGLKSLESIIKIPT